MDEPTPSRHRRRERRRDRTPPAVEAPPEPVVEAAADETTAEETTAEETTAEETTADETAADETAAPAARRKARARRTDAERSLRGIVGAGASQVGVVGAMRARDAAKPTEDDMAAAERDLVIVRRHYVPPDALPGAR